MKFYPSRDAGIYCCNIYHYFPNILLKYSNIDFYSQIGLGLGFLLAVKSNLVLTLFIFGVSADKSRYTLFRITACKNQYLNILKVY